MDSSLQPYSYIVHKPFFYSFTTDKGVEYVCYFTPYAEYFKSYPSSISSKFFAFNLELLDKHARTKGIDKRIAHTVITIVGDFLDAQTNAVVYVCDTSDSKEAIRAKKFKSWFNYYEFSDQILQVDSNFIVGDMKLYTTLLVHRKNKLKKELIAAYIELTTTEEGK